VGMAMLTVPPSYKATQRTWLHQIKSGLVYPVVDSLSVLLSESWSAKEVHRAEIRKKRNEVMGDGDFFVLDLFPVHPSCHRRGVGKVLLQYCISLATSWNTPS